jgi:5-methylthioadenosine/S-adenosylhomocysteine deaminase
LKKRACRADRQDGFRRSDHAAARQAFAMATRMGAQALHIDAITGSWRSASGRGGSDLAALHTRPLARDEDALLLPRLPPGSDVRHVVWRIWLMRDRTLLTVRTDQLLEQASQVARQIDTFLVEREGDVLQKLLAIGELQREESFEVQVKARLDDPERVQAILQRPDVKVVRHSHYRQYDTYFEFRLPDQRRVRYREDDFLDDGGEVANVRTRLTLTDQGKESEFEDAILLSRSRYISPATRPLRFYREYFHADSERTIVKERRRWHIDFRDLRLYVNVDELLDPPSDHFYLEIKSRTWSRRDAELKAQAISALLDTMGIGRADRLTQEYVELV